MMVSVMDNVWLGGDYACYFVTCVYAYRNIVFFHNIVYLVNNYWTIVNNSANNTEQTPSKNVTQCSIWILKRNLAIKEFSKPLCSHLDIN